MKIFSNIIPEKTVRKVQKETIGIIADALAKSFGPNGSTTVFIKSIDSKGANISTNYTKDGYTIISNIQFINPIERSIQNDLTELTRYVVKEVGDGTTSAVVLCKTIFDALCNNTMIANNKDSDIIHDFNELINNIKDRINELGKECTLEDIYDIALISTNNNEEIAGTIMQIYKKYGMDVFIDIGISNEIDNIVKEYDGMTMNTGYSNICMINDKEHNTCAIRNPKVYCFNDPIDTPEMLALLNKIIYENIFKAYERGSVTEPVPTVIFCHKISPDTDSYFESVIRLMNQYPGRVPLLIVSDIHQYYLYEDIAKMCGAPFIKKYISPEIQQKDVEAGLAPTVETIVDFCGHADEIVSDEYKTKIIRPAKMFKEDGVTYSDEYNMMVNYLETQVEKARLENAGVDAIQNAKRRLNCFKGNMIDFLIGGVTISDRDNLKSSVEDAVLNCRSAAINGVGYGANFMAFKVLHELKNNSTNAEKSIFIDILYSAYKELLGILYDASDKELDDIVDNMIKNDCPLNITTNQYDGKVKSSIKTDIAILETIKRILILMFTSNQYLIQNAMHNIYNEE